MMAQNPAQSSQQDDVPVVGQWSLTQTKEVKCNYTWTIDNFKSHCEKTSEMIKSPCFFVDGNDNIKWRLDLYPKGRMYHRGKTFVSLFLKLVSCEKSEVIAGYVFSILDCQYIQTNIKELQTKHFKQGTDYGYHKFIGRDYLLDRSNGLLTEDKLTICCEVSLKVDTVNISRQGDLVQVQNPRACVLDDIGKLYDNKTLSDVTLVAGGKEIRAHKLILAARSAVFAAMFEHDMQEQKLSCVEITDVDHDVLIEVLRYIYTDRVPNLYKMAADLLVAADKYALDSLKVMCEEALCRNLSVEKAADTLVLADLHSVERLKEQTITFINSRHVGMVMETEGWKKMISTHPHLVEELFRKMTVMLQQHLRISPTDMKTDDDKAKSEATFRYIVENFEDLDDTVTSPPCYVRNLPWQILVEPYQEEDEPKTLDVFLQCNGVRESSSWSCYAEAKVKLLSHKPEKKPIVRKIQHLFCSTDVNMGLSFVNWSDVLDPENGFLKDDAITLEVHVTADTPHGVGWDTKKHTGYIDMMAQNPAQSSQQDDVPVVGQWSLTQTKEVKCNYTWTIDKFKSQYEEAEAGEMINSPCFSVDGNDNIKWRLDLYPKGCRENSVFVSLFLKLVSCENSEVIASYAFSILHCDYIQTKKAKTLQTKHFRQGTNYGNHKFIRRDYLLDRSNDLLNEDKLTICCEVSVMVDTVNISGQGDLVQVQNPRECVSDDFGKLYDNKTLSDVTLVAGGKEIRAHKLILAARSSVFAAMFEHDMQEQKLSRVDITDVDHDTLTEMLRYIYTGRVPNIDTMAADLLAAANKYALDRLKVMCEEALCRNLSVETAADTLVLADLHSVDRLKKQTIAFINSRHVGMVMETEGWKKMISTHPHLVAELFTEVTVLLQKHLPNVHLTSACTGVTNSNEH